MIKESNQVLQIKWNKKQENVDPVYNMMISLFH